MADLGFDIFDCGLEEITVTNPDSLSTGRLQRNTCHQIFPFPEAAVPHAFILSAFQVTEAAGCVPSLERHERDRVAAMSDSDDEEGEPGSGSFW